MWQTGGLVVAAALASMLTSAGPPYRATDWLGVGMAVAAAGALLWRRVAPVPVLVVTGLLVVANAAAGFPPTVVPWTAWIALYTCFALYGWRVRVMGVAIALGAVAGYAIFDRGSAMPEVLFGVLMTFLFATVAGDAARNRSAVAVAEQARLRAEERAELARELHDSLGHAVNVMVMQAGVGHRLFDENPAFAQEALGHVATVGRDALDELDHLVHVVQADHPPPDLARLAERIRAAGRDLRLRTEEVDLSAPAARALHRIAQEAITNALRHTSSGRITVELTQDRDLAVLEIVNESEQLSTGPPGRGLANMRDRARSVGGDLQAGPVEGGFRVHATLPAQVRP